MAGGKDFVTQGPTEAVLVLRDPPGSLSYAYAEEGLTISNSSTVTSGTASNVDRPRIDDQCRSRCGNGNQDGK